MNSVYNGAEETDSQPMVWVGKGVTFDTGGISIKPSSVRHRAGEKFLCYLSTAGHETHAR